MAEANTAITIIVPTCGVAGREHSLRQAVESILAQESTRALPLVVLNGDRCSPQVRQWLTNEHRIRLIELQEPGLPGALRAGRAAVETPCFGTLDDDDFLLPGALSLRLEALRADPSLDVVITNGLVRNGSGDVLNIAEPDPICRDPLRALLGRNWLLPGSWLARSDRVPAELFDGMPRFLECTFLAVRFATEYRMRWLAEPTLVYRYGSPDALSQSRAYVYGQAEALGRILALRIDADVRDALRRRIAEAFHSAADHDMHAGMLRDAWRWHLASLRAPGGWRFLPFTARLARASWRRA